MLAAFDKLRGLPLHIHAVQMVHTPSHADHVLQAAVSFHPWKLPWVSHAHDAPRPSSIGRALRPVGQLYHGFLSAPHAPMYKGKVKPREAWNKDVPIAYQ